MHDRHLPDNQFDCQMSDRFGHWFRRSSIAKDGPGCASDRACRTLGGIIFVDRNALFRNHTRRDHFQQIKLRSDLEHRASVLRICMQLPCIANQFRDLYISRVIGACSGSRTEVSRVTNRSPNARTCRSSVDFEISVSPFTTRLSRTCFRRPLRKAHQF